MKKFIILAIMCSSLFAKAQQEPQYTLNQFNSNLEINPAYAGANDDASLSLRYRKQWVGFTGSPSTLCFNGESKIIKQRLALGLTIVGDWIGITQSTYADLSVASHLRLGAKGTLSVGIKLGVQFLKSDFSKLSNVDLTDPLYNTNASVFIPYAGFGALFYTRKLYIGFAVPQVVSFENVAPQSKIIKPHFFLYGGYRVILNSDFELRPALLCKYVTAAPFEADIAIDAWFKGMVGVGVSYRTSDAVNFMIKGRLGNFYLGYSYDMTVSGLRPYNSGTHEIYLGFEFGKKGNPDRKQNNRYF
ncbi:MAG: type IX secretion system membrane protein PorP/SprF [Bacteroidetes bacterium]|nr:type IX secretion system membrane protein PorP/SprF [Bacteroidota bacterium]